MSKSVLAIDVGNSSTALGIYRSGRLLRKTRTPTGDITVKSHSALLEDFIASDEISGVALASVAPRVTPSISRAIRKVLSLDVLDIDCRMKLGAPISYPDPESIGADRLANLAGCVARYEAPVIVVDIGTATTFDVIQPRRGYTGGIIAPGPDLMLEYLAEKTALLPRLDLTPVRTRIGKTTGQAMRLGALHGYRGMVKEITHYLMRSMKARKVTLCATGGYARWVLKGMDLPFIYDSDLTLFGIFKIYEWNSSA